MKKSWIALGMMATMVAQPVMAGTIAQQKEKAPRRVIETTATKDDAVLCVQSVYQGHNLNRFDNRDGSTDIAAMMMGWRMALWTIKPVESGLVLEGRDQMVNRNIVEQIGECLNTVPA